MFQSRTENQNSHVGFNKFFFFENRAFYGKVETFLTAGQATDGCMAHARCMLDT
jgi:hypothetical protein